MALHAGARGQAKRDVCNPRGPILASEQIRVGTDQEHLSSLRRLDQEPLMVKETACVFVSGDKLTL